MFAKKEYRKVKEPEIKSIILAIYCHRQAWKLYVLFHTERRLGNDT